MGVGYKFQCSHCNYNDVVSPNKHYVRDDKDNVSVCSDEEVDFINQILEKCKGWAELHSFADRKTFMESHTGWGSDHICLSCKDQWFHVPELKPNKCPSCASKEIKDMWFLRDGPCPHCKEGTITAGMEPDWIS